MFDPTFERGKDYTLRPSVIFGICQQMDAFNVDASSAHTCVAQTKESRPVQCPRAGVQTCTLGTVATLVTLLISV